MKKAYQCSVEEVFTNVKSSEKGLSSDEAQTRLSTGGENILKQKTKKKPITIFLSQFNNMMIILLILVGIVSLVYSIVTNESVIEAIVIFGCVLVNAFMGFFQELKSENTIEALRDLTVSKVKVKRDENYVETDATKLVVGDVILLEAGDKVPADARIIKAVSAKVDESILTGESIAVEKHAVTISKDVLLQDRKNIVYSGTNVVNGRIEAQFINLQEKIKWRVKKLEQG